VTATPGTTRDLVTERVSIAGIPVELVDTAGLREATDEAERLGIAKSREAMADADVVLLVVDGMVGIDKEDRAVMQGYPAIVAWNKSDLASESRGREADPSAALRDETKNMRDGKKIATSAVTGEGIGELREALVRAVAGDGALREAGMLTNLRQHQAVQSVVRRLDAAREAVGARIPHEMVLLDLYDALRGLDALTGATTNEDVLRLIFSRFCIGK